MNKDKWTELASEITEWHENCFPDATLEGQLVKLEEEFTEWMAATGVEDYGKELADIFIVCCGLGRWNTVTGRIITMGLLNDLTHYNDVFYKQVYNKHQKNKARIWQKLLRAPIITWRVKNGLGCYLCSSIMAFYIHQINE